MSARIYLIALLGLLCLGLAACASQPSARHLSAHSAPVTHQPVTHQPEPDAAIIVPGSNGVLARRIRRDLAAHGWRLVRYTTAKLKSDRNYRAMARQARYRLTLAATAIGACRDGQPGLFYHLSLIENTSGTVALALAGTNCLDTVSRRFASDLERKQIVPPANQRHTGTRQPELAEIRLGAQTGG